MSSLNTKTFNSYDYGFEIVLLNKNADIAQKFTKGEILELTLVRDITEYYTTGSVKIKDDSNSLGVLAKNDGEWMIGVSICQEASASGLLAGSSTFEKTFLVSNTSIDSIDANGAHVTIDFIDPIAQILNRNCAYSNQKCEDISKILFGLFESVGFKAPAGLSGGLSLSNVVNMATQSGDPRTLPSISDIGTKINYITDGSTPVINHIDYILSQIYSEDKGFLFLFFDPTEDQFQAYWSKDVLDESAATTILKNAAVYGKVAPRFIEITNSDDSSKSTNVVTQMNPYNFLLDYRDSTNLIYPTYIQEFDYKTHRVKIDSKDKWSDKTFLNLFKQGKLPNTHLPTVLENPKSAVGTNSKFYTTSPDYAIGNFYRKANRDEFYKKLRNYFLYANMFSVKLLGNLFRKPGEAYFVRYMQFPNADELNGVWFCPRIVDVFSGQEYYQHVFLNRLSDTAEYSKIAKEIKSKKN